MVHGYNIKINQELKNDQLHVLSSDWSINLNSAILIKLEKNRSIDYKSQSI